MNNKKKKNSKTPQTPATPTKKQKYPLFRRIFAPDFNGKKIATCHGTTKSLPTPYQVPAKTKLSTPKKTTSWEESNKESSEDSQEKSEQ